MDPDEYDEDSYSGGAKQDEWLISPVVDLTGKDATLHFVYGFATSPLYNGKMTYTAEATTDGGQDLERDLGCQERNETVRL